MKTCKSDEIRNPLTNRCVKKSGKIGRNLVKSPKPCKSDEIRNPITNRCVKKTGKIGRNLVKSSKKKSPRVSSDSDVPLARLIKKKKISPKKKSPRVLSDSDVPLARLIKKKKISPKKKSPVRISPSMLRRASKDCIDRSNLKLKPHQIKVAKYMLNKDKGGLLVVHGVGSGKTLTGVTVSQCHLDNHPNDNIFVITPVSLQENFKKEMIRYGTDPADKRYKFYTITGFYNAYMRKEIDTKNSMMIVDEAHNLRTLPQRVGITVDLLRKRPAKKTVGKKKKDKDEIEGKQTVVMIDACSHARKVLLLTATPLYNKPGDINSLINMIQQRGTLSVITRKSKLFEEKNNAVLDCASSIYGSVARDGYPSSKVHEVFLDMSDSFREKYEQIENDMEEAHAFVRGGMNESNLGAFYNGVRRASNNLESEQSEKVNWVLRKIRASKPNQKFVIFSNFVTSGVDLIKTRLGEDVQFATINGEMSMKERNKIVKKYNADELKILFITKAGGEGLDLKRTKYVILVEPGWNEAGMNQVIGRAVRFESHKDAEDTHVDVYRLFLISKEEHAILPRIIEENITVTDEEYPHPRMTVDLFLRNKQLTKEIKNDTAMDILRSKSIEEMDCDSHVVPVDIKLVEMDSYKSPKKKSPKKKSPKKKSPKKKR